jgi:hypothetical protein
MKQNGKKSWRASLENPHTKQQQFFYCVEDLIHYLDQLNQEQEVRKES